MMTTDRLRLTVLLTSRSVSVTTTRSSAIPKMM